MEVRAELVVVEVDAVEEQQLRLVNTYLSEKVVKQLAAVGTSICQREVQIAGVTKS